MTVQEFGKLADAIKTYFPRDNILPTNTSMELWYDMLKDLDYRAAYTGLRAHVASSRFAPTIADIREKSLQVNQPRELNETEAWSLVSKAIRNSSYNSVEEFAKLPQLVQKAVGQPSQLRIWAIDENYNEEVVSSLFTRTYRAECKRKEMVTQMNTQEQQMYLRNQTNSYSTILDKNNAETIKSSKEEEKLKIGAKYEATEGIENNPRYQKLKKRLKAI